MAEFVTEWTGRYPTLCSGIWHLYRDGEEINVKDIPFNYDDCDPEWFHARPAETFGTYSLIYFGRDFEERYEEYADGLSVEEWIEKYRDWLETIAEEADFSKVYAAFQENDFRHTSCGGCL